MTKRSLIYAYDVNKKLVHVDSVENGIDCNCYCPACSDPLIARNKGEKREHHFTHLNKECPDAYLRQILILSKNILIENGYLLLPKSDYLINNQPYIKESAWQIDRINDEIKINDMIQGLSLYNSNNEQLIIIFNTNHLLEKDTLDKTIKTDQLVLEINLAKSDKSLTKKDLIHLLLYDTTAKRWLKSQKIDEYYDKLLSISWIKPVYAKDEILTVENCPIKKADASVEKDCVNCPYRFIPHPITDILDAYDKTNHILCLGDVLTIDTIFLNKIKQIKNKKNQLEILTEDELLIFKRKSINKNQPDSIFNTWINNNLKDRAFLINVKTKYGVLFTKSPIEQYNKYRRIYGLLYGFGKPMGNREIFFASKKDWLYQKNKEE